jgi:hypothetical protein
VLAPVVRRKGGMVWIDSWSPARWARPSAPLREVALSCVMAVRRCVFCSLISMLASLTASNILSRWCTRSLDAVIVASDYTGRLFEE